MLSSPQAILKLAIVLMILNLLGIVVVLLLFGFPPRP
jgi:hypothetical protein